MSEDQTVLVELQCISGSENQTLPCEMHDKFITIEFQDLIKLISQNPCSSEEIKLSHNRMSPLILVWYVLCHLTQLRQRK